ncbi:MAG: S8 family serine peptidase, partial [Chloroflexi bacterium]|nr:S8 family serine peptidase [Chloroflexota bacterium]
MIEAKLGNDVLARVRAAPDDHPHPVIVRYRTTRQGRGRVAAFRLIDDLAISIDHHDTVVPAVAGRATRRQISALSDDPTVEMVWYDSPVHTLLDASVPLIGAPQLWPSGLTGKGIKICIVDTGIDLDHPDFAGRIAATRDFTGEGVKDGHGHGTHVASTAAGSGAASNGKYRGVAPDANLLIAKVMTANGAGSTSDVMAGVEWAVQQGAHVINLSLGSDGSCDGSDALSQTCDAAVQRGHAVCIAAGNAGPNAATVGSPGCAHQAITIGATDDDDAIASFSSRGPTADGRVKPDVCFPGVRIVAARAKGTSMGRAVDDFYTSASGTSMATPHASGTCALLAQAHPSTTPAQVKDALMKTAKNLRLDGNVVGAGRAQVVDAVHLLGRVPAPQPVPPPAPTPAPVTPPSPAPPIPQPPRRGCLPAAVVLMM